MRCLALRGPVGTPPLALPEPTTELMNNLNPIMAYARCWTPTWLPLDALAMGIVCLSPLPLTLLIHKLEGMFSRCQAGQGHGKDELRGQALGNRHKEQFGALSASLSTTSATVAPAVASELAGITSIQASEHRWSIGSLHRNLPSPQYSARLN